MSSIKGINLLCFNYGSSTKKGELNLPPEFCCEFGDKIPEYVYLGIRNGDAWRGVYRPNRACIENLGKMMDYYSIKPYSVFLLEYNGDGNFKTEIFDHNAVEICYPLRTIPFKKPRVTDQSFSSIELDKMAGKFFYNASSHSRVSYDLIIKKEHLEQNTFVEVLSEEGISNLGLNEEMSWIELTLNEERRKWVINLKWENRMLLFNKNWKAFAESVNLREGDVCVMQRCLEFQKFKVAIFEKEDNIEFDIKGNEQSNSARKCFKIIVDDMLGGGDLELPRKFMKSFGVSLRKNVTLVMGDGKEYHVNYCSMNNCIYGLKDFFYQYKVTESYTIFFHYLGQSKFYISVFSTLFMDICNGNPKKLVLKDVHKLVVENTVMSYRMSEDSSSDDSSDSSSEDSLLSNVVVDSLLQNETLIAEDHDDTRNVYFFANLSSSHVDQKGHGVYFPRHMIPIYRPWKRSTLLTLVYGRRMWKVALLRKKKMCRFGLGWNDFTKDNKFTISQKLKFVYVGNCAFKVSLAK